MLKYSYSDSSAGADIYRCHYVDITRKCHETSELMNNFHKCDLTCNNIHYTSLQYMSVSSI